jgi:hypothetical protein
MAVRARLRPLASIVFPLVSLLVLSSLNVSAQQGTLTVDEVRAAFERGKKKKVKDIGHKMSPRSKGSAVASGLLFPGDDSYVGTLTIYTPTVWIERIAAQAAADFIPLTPDRLPPSDLAPVLRVFTDLRGVTQMVLRDKKKAMVIAPLAGDTFGIAGVSSDIASQVGSALGLPVGAGDRTKGTSPNVAAGQAPSGVPRMIPFNKNRLERNPPEFQFGMDEVRELRAQSPDVLITLIAYSSYGGGARLESTVEITKKDFEKRLP